jgi:hypothetical protein
MTPPAVLGFNAFGAVQGAATVQIVTTQPALAGEHVLVLGGNASWHGNDFSSVTDSAGNVYVSRYVGSPGNSIDLSVYDSVLTHDLPSGGVISLHNDPNDFGWQNGQAVAVDLGPGSTTDHVGTPVGGGGEQTENVQCTGSNERVVGAFLCASSDTMLFSPAYTNIFNNFDFFQVLRVDYVDGVGAGAAPAYTVQPSAFSSAGGIAISMTLPAPPIPNWIARQMGY